MCYRWRPRVIVPSRLGELAQEGMALFPARVRGLDNDLLAVGGILQPVAGEVMVEQPHDLITKRIAVTEFTDLTLKRLVLFIDDQDNRDAVYLASLEFSIEDMATPIRGVVERELVPGTGPALDSQQRVLFMEEVGETLCQRL